MPDKPKFYNTRQAADYLGLKESTLEKWRVTGAGPAFVALSGRAVRYRESDLCTFIESRLRRSTSEVR